MAWSLTRESVSKEPCHCVSCDMCGGTGREESRWDFGCSDPCEECGGGGITDLCERCQLLTDMDYDEEEERCKNNK